jgi:signal transduction histidine kinase
VRRLPRRTVRLRLTLLYGGLFVACGAALLAINYLLVAHEYKSGLFLRSGKHYVTTATAPSGADSVYRVAHAGGLKPPARILFPGVVIEAQGLPSPTQIVAQANAQSNAALHQLLLDSGIALPIMTVVALGLGWIVAGRVLRPLRTITNAAREISASDLHRRLALAGPDDELTELGNTFDGLLERLEASFEAQRRFVANASHELRTPLTLERARVEVALTDPEASAGSLRSTLDDVLAANRHQERLIEALLVLSRSQRGLEAYQSVDLAAIAGEVVDSHVPSRIALDARLDPARTTGDPALVERLVDNLVTNAIAHNVEDGWVNISTQTVKGRAVLTVENSGPVVPPGELDRLFQPFQRLDGERGAGRDGFGLGLSIVQAIATAHRATIAARARPGGGLAVEVGFPAAILAPRAAPSLARAWSDARG